MKHIKLSISMSLRGARTCDVAVSDTVLEIASAVKLPRNDVKDFANF